MNTTNESSGTEGLSTVIADLLKTDLLGRVTLGCEQREAVLDAFEASDTYRPVSNIDQNINPNFCLNVSLC